MSVPETKPDPKAVRRHARALIRAAGYEPAQVMWFSLYENHMRLTIVTADGVQKVQHPLPGGNQQWRED